MLGETPQTPMIDSYVDKQLTDTLKKKQIENEKILLPGEIVLHQIDVKDALKVVDVRMILTNHRLVLIGQEEDESNSVPYGALLKVKANSDKKISWIDITTKDQRVFKIKFDSPYSQQRTIEILT